MDGDYYSTVYAWFEKCGIISNIRTHLRQNLVTALKSKDMTLNKGNIPPKSAKQYIYDLLIAEYLWNHHYVYSLSVFASEAPLLVNFRKFVSKSDDEPSENKLQEEYVCHTLETLGIKPEDPGGRTIIADYSKNDVPLLLAILKYTSQVSQIDCVARRSRKNSVRTQNCATQTEISVQDYSSEKSKIISAKKKLLRQKETYSSQLKDKEEDLKLRASTIEQQIVILNQKLTEAKTLMRAADAKEREILEIKRENERYIYKKQLELSVKENSLIREAERLEVERTSYQAFESNLRRLQDELARLQGNLPQMRTHDTGTQTEFSQNKRMEEETRSLQSLVRDQQSRIEELTLKTVRLSRQLEEAQLNKWTNVPKPLSQSTKLHTVLSESSSTDEIIQDAKQRLKRLEQESLKADQSYLNCISSIPLL